MLDDVLDVIATKQKNHKRVLDGKKEVLGFYIDLIHLY